MQHIELLVTVLEYIEIHLRDDIKTDDIASVLFLLKVLHSKNYFAVYITFPFMNTLSEGE